MAYLIQILISVMMATFMSMMIPRASVSADRIQAKSSRTESSVHRAGRERSPTLATPESVSSTGSTSSYPGARHPVLRDLSFGARPARPPRSSAPPGRQDDPGRLVPRLFDSRAAGSSAVSTSARSTWTPSVTDRPGPAAPLPVLRHGRHDAALRQPAGHRRPELWEALRVAQAEDFVERGCPTSSSRRSPRAVPTCRAANDERLAIARALVRKPEVYLFDDAFSALGPLDRRSPAPSAETHHERGDGDRRGATGVDHHRCRSHRGPGGRPSSSAWERMTELLEAS